MKTVNKKKYFKILEEIPISKTDLEQMDTFDIFVKLGGIVLFETDKSYDFGYEMDCTLQEKASFYVSISKFACIIKYILEKYEENFYASGINDEFYSMGLWPEEKEFDAYQNYKNYFKLNKIYNIKVPEELFLLDYILETTVRGFTDIKLVLPKSKLVLYLSEHMLLGIHGKNASRLIPELKMFIQNNDFTTIVVEKAIGGDGQY